MRILLVDDDLELATVMQTVFEQYTISLVACEHPNGALSLLQEQAFDAVLLDVMLPETNGFELCRQIRALNSPAADVAIIFLTARTGLPDLVVGLETGADDYVKKPFEPRELVARIHAVLRRVNGVRDQVEQNLLPAQNRRDRVSSIMLDDCVLSVDVERARVEVNGRRLIVTSMEFELLVALVKAQGQTLSRDEALINIQGAGLAYTRSVDALIYRLRSKIRSLGGGTDFIRTVRGRGYAIVGQRNALEIQ
ncbi:MAG: response regulator transcription factor [Geminicoccaceae bacterium]